MISWFFIELSWGGHSKYTHHVCDVRFVFSPLINYSFLISPLFNSLVWILWFLHSYSHSHFHSIFSFRHLFLCIEKCCFHDLTDFLWKFTQNKTQVLSYVVWNLCTKKRRKKTASVHDRSSISTCTVRCTVTPLYYCCCVIQYCNSNDHL
jgi:hypothetical protein